MQRIVALFYIQKEVRISAYIVTQQVIVKTAVRKSNQSVYKHGEIKTSLVVISSIANTMAGKIE